VEASAWAKPWKGAELITRQTFRFGAFEARIRAARGSGMITPFFLWKDGSERPGALWQEQDFEIFGRDGQFQTQLMTPGKDGEVRTEHVWNHWLPVPAWERYYTYRMEWTPDALSFYIDGQLIRRETDKTEFSKFMNPAEAEAAQLRVSIWAGDWEWSSRFDPSAVPQAVFVNWIQAYSHTPGSGPNGTDFTLLWRDDFNSLSSNRWTTANWTFEHAVNDYIPANATAKSGALVLVFTSENATGRFPAVPSDDGLEIPLGPPWSTGPFVLPARIEAEAYGEAFDTTAGNSGDAKCGSGDVDAQVTSDSNRGFCNVGWVRPGEWLEYEVEVASAESFDLNLRLAAEPAGQHLHVEIDGVDVTGPVPVPASGWTKFNDVLVEGIALETGPHVVRVVFDTGWVNMNYFEFLGEAPTEPTCTPATAVYEAESLSGSAGQRTSDGWNLWSNGSLSANHAFQAGDSVVRVRALGQPAQGVFPHMIVRVGGQTVGDVTVNSTSYAPYEFFYSAASGSSAVSVSFDNDYYQNGQDRNLLIDSIAVDECVN
jgi:hypothetical protein